MGFLSFDNIVNQQVETSLDQAVENHKIEMNPLTPKKKMQLGSSVRYTQHRAQTHILNTLFLFYITEDSKRNFQQYVNKDWYKQL